MTILFGVQWKHARKTFKIYRDTRRRQVQQRLLTFWVSFHVLTWNTVNMNVKRFAWPWEIRILIKRRIATGGSVNYPLQIISHVLRQQPWQVATVRSFVVRRPVL